MIKIYKESEGHIDCNITVHPYCHGFFVSLNIKAICILFPCILIGLCALSFINS